jgi:hypothetical protein
MTDCRKALAAAVKDAGVTRKGQPLHLTPKTLRKAHITWQKMRGMNDSPFAAAGGACLGLQNHGKELHAHSGGGDEGCPILATSGNGNEKGASDFSLTP